MTTISPLPLILASSSVYRGQLLERLGIPFASHSPNIDETRLAEETTTDLCLRLAIEKAQALAAIYPQHLVIGSDQAAATAGLQLQKPGNFHNALNQLRSISGKTVTFYTALAVLNTATGQAITDIDATQVQVRTLSDQEITAYLEKEQPYDCAGSFKVEGLGISLFDKVSTDDPTALIGLPLIKLCNLLRRTGVSIP